MFCKLHKSILMEDGPDGRTKMRHTKSMRNTWNDYILDDECQYYIYHHSARNENSLGIKTLVVFKSFHRSIWSGSTNENWSICPFDFWMDCLRNSIEKRLFEKHTNIIWKFWRRYNEKNAINSHFILIMLAEKLRTETFINVCGSNQFDE